MERKHKKIEAWLNENEAAIFKINCENTGLSEADLIRQLCIYANNFILHYSGHNQHLLKDLVIKENLKASAINNDEKMALDNMFKELSSVLTLGGA